MEGRFETYVRPSRGMAAWPTNDDLTVVIAGWPYAEFEANKKDIEGNFFKSFDLAPAFAERLRAGYPGDPFCWYRGVELPAQALRSGMGAGRRRRVQQGFHYGSGNP